jgi:hypothetical protein
MDPSLLQPSRQGNTQETEAGPSTMNNHAHNDRRESTPDFQDNHTDYDSQDDDNPSTSLGPDGAKRPRLRLAHACDRCRKRKIRCDTHHPCGPCQATKNECTFHTPSRRPAKPKSSEQRSSSTAGFKRPHSPVKDQTALEARLAALEAMLRDVPPNVHNAFLSTLDARLGSGTSVGIKEGKGEGVNVALEALMGNQKWSEGNAAASGSGANQGNWSALGGMTGGWAGGRSLTKKREEEGVNEMAKRMEGMSFFYEDEIGQAKWQGGSFVCTMNEADDQVRRLDSRSSSCSPPRMSTQACRTVMLSTIMSISQTLLLRP